MNIPLTPPQETKKILVHSCCAPCSGEIIEKLLSEGFTLTLYYYNSNVYPEKEYLRRKNESERFCAKKNIDFVDAGYDPDRWLAETEAFAQEPERGQRCTICFKLRFDKTADYAHDHGFKVFTSTLGISRWKDLDQVNAAGLKAAERHPDVSYWTHNWRKQGGSQRMHEIARKENFYKQNYCGCVYSLEQTRPKEGTNQ